MAEPEKEIPEDELPRAVTDMLVEKKLEIIPTNDESAATFVVTDEDHTLGNSLRHLIAKNKKTSFCGYSVPHPAEPKMNIRVQTHGDAVAQTVFREGVQTLRLVSDHVLETFNAAEKKFTSKQPSKSQPKAAAAAPKGGSKAKAMDVSDDD